MGRQARDRLSIAQANRERAKELRTIADGLSRDVERKLLHNLADDYERQAKNAEYRSQLRNNQAAD